MNDGPLRFSVIPNKDEACLHPLELGSFPVNYGLPSVLGPFLRAGEELGCPREVVDIFDIEIINFYVLYYRSRTIVPIPRGLMIPLIPLPCTLSPVSRDLYSL